MFTEALFLIVPNRKQSVSTNKRMKKHIFKQWNSVLSNDIRMVLTNIMFSKRNRTSKEYIISKAGNAN